MSVGSTTSSGSTTIDSSRTGFNGLTADDFFKLLIAQLQNQDPSEPVGNEELLAQLSTMRNLQSNIELGEVLKKLSTSLDSQNADYGQKLSVAASYIGQSVTLDDLTVGRVEHAFLEGGQTFIGVNGVDVPLSRVIAVNSSESFVGRLVSTSVVNAEGLSETVTGVVQSVSKQNGSDVLNVSLLDADGNVSQATVAPDRVKHIFTANGLVGRRVQIVDDQGVQHSGIATAATVSGVPGISVAGTAVKLDRVVSVGLP